MDKTERPRGAKRRRDAFAKLDAKARGHQILKRVGEHLGQHPQTFTVSIHPHHDGVVAYILGTDERIYIPKRDLDLSDLGVY